MYILRFILFIMIVCCFSLGFGDELKNNKKVIGVFEKILLLPEGIEMPAKLDTGADTSSIHGEKINIIERDGKKYISFVFNWNKNGLEEQLRMEKPFVRYIKVKRKGNLKSDKRPVISLEFCLDGKKYNSEFSIADRDNFRYPLLLGRDFLRRSFIIDPDSDYLTDINACEKYINSNK